MDNLRLFETLVVFQVYFLIFDFFLVNGFSKAFFFQPTWTLWYLLSLIFWRIILYALRSINMITLLSSSLTFAVLVGFTPFDYPLSLQRTFVFLPFFVAGHIAHRKNWISIIRNIKHKWFFTLPVIAIFVLSILYIKTDIGYITNCAHNFYHFPQDNLSRCCLYRVSYLCIATIMTVCFLAISVPNDIASKLGKDSLKYYMFHPFIIIATTIIIRHFNLGNRYITVVLLTVFIMISITILNRFDLSDILLNPVSYVVKKCPGSTQ